MIGSTAVGTLYKGTLSSGVEIAVISFSTAASKDWSRNLETQFREKVPNEIILKKLLLAIFIREVTINISSKSL